MSRPGSRFRRGPVTRLREKNYETRNPFTPSRSTACQDYHGAARRLQLHGAPRQRIFREIFEQFWHNVQCMPDRPLHVRDAGGEPDGPQSRAQASSIADETAGSGKGKRTVKNDKCHNSRTDPLMGVPPVAEGTNVSHFNVS